jgi:hypothetical protein
LDSQRAAWVTFDHPKLGKFGILNVYPPTGENSSAERKRLWREIFNSLPNIISWLMIGDFNMTEKASNQTGGRQKVISGREKRSWR